MKILDLTTKQATLDAIKAGELKEYSREIRPNTQKKYCEMDEDGYVKDVDGGLQPRKYDAVRFKCGHESYACKIDNAYIELFENEKHELITYVENGEEYIAAQIVYKLGEQITV